MNSARKAVVLLTVGTLFGFEAYCARPTSSENVPVVIRDYRFKDLTGMTVEDGDGETLGKLKNLIMDWSSGQVEYAIITWRPLWQPGFRLKIAPAARLSTVTTKQRTLFLDVVENLWRRAPAFRTKDLATLNTPDRSRKIHAFYGHSDPPDISGQSATVLLKPTGSILSNQSKSQSGKLVLASDLIGMSVTNDQNEQLGKICDLLVAPSGSKPASAIIVTGGLFKRQSHYRVPVTALVPGEKSQRVLKYSISSHFSEADKMPPL